MAQKDVVPGAYVLTDRPADQNDANNQQEEQTVNAADYKRR